MTVSDATTVVVMHARNYTNARQMPFGTSFAAGARLRNYSPHNGSFFVTVGNDGRLRGDGDPNPVLIPSGGYFAFSYDVPQLPNVWQGSAIHSIDIVENGAAVPTIGVVRKDGADGDSAYQYTAQIPLVRHPENLHFIARADGSAANILMKLDGGIDLNSQMNPPGQTPFTVGRDNRPGAANDTFLGYEQMRFVHRVVEQFAAQIITSPARDVIGSPGAETWQCTIGAAGFTLNQGAGITTDTDTADWAYHNPGAADIDGTAQAQFSPAPVAAAGQPVTVWVKIAHKSDGISRAWIYYTTDGVSFPEGSAGVARGATRVAPLSYDRDSTPDANGTPEWWRGVLPALPAGTVLHYKIGVHKNTAAPRFPFTADDVSKKQRGETLFEIANFNGTACTVYPYVDATRPAGQVVFPAENATIGGSTYGFVAITDASVSDVQFNILDSIPGNDSAANGNGAGNWAAANEVTPTQIAGTAFEREWRFDYKNIPGSGAAVVKVRLREASSSPDNALADEAGWFTTLDRAVNTGFPVKVYFDKSLGFIAGQPVPDAQMIGEFEIRLDGALIPRSRYTFIRDETGSESALAFTFPAFYTGNPDDLHEVRATQARGDVSLTDIRMVKAAPGDVLDSDGDGLPDFWEIQNSLDAHNPDGDEGRAGDKDADGVSAALEYLAGLNATDPNDGLPAIMPRVLRNGALWQLQFPVIPNRVYQVESRGLDTLVCAGGFFFHGPRSELGPPLDRPAGGDG